MSEIKFTLNTHNKVWSVEKQDLMGKQTEVSFAFTSLDKITQFNSPLLMGYQLTQGDTLLQNFSHPPIGQKISQVTRAPVVTTVIDVKSDKTYSFKVWAEVNSERIEETIEVRIPREASPFPSWNWDPEEDTWSAPIEMPTGPLVCYAWNEENQNWEAGPEQ